MSYLCVMLKTSSFDKIKKTSLVISIEINQINLTLNFELYTISQTHEASQSSCMQLRFSHLRLH